MTAGKLTENKIRIWIVPTHLRWPEAGKSVVWRRLHECVQQLHEYARTVDDKCNEIEQNHDHGRDGIDRQRTEVAHEAQKKLANFGPFVIAEQAATKEIDMLKKRESLTTQEAQAKQMIEALDELRVGGCGDGASAYGEVQNARKVSSPRSILLTRSFPGLSGNLVLWTDCSGIDREIWADIRTLRSRRASVNGLTKR